MPLVSAFPFIFYYSTAYEHDTIKLDSHAYWNMLHDGFLVRYLAVIFYAINVYGTYLTGKGRFGLSNSEVSSKYPTVITPAG